MECDTLEIFRRYLIHIFLIGRAEYDIRYAGTLGSQEFLLYASYGEHLASQGYLSGHCNILAHLALGQRRCDARCYRDACRGAVLWSRALRNVDVNVPLFEDAIVNVQVIRMSLYVFQCYHGTLLHHITQIAGEGELARLSLGQRGLDEQYLTSHAGPRQSCHHAGVVVALIDITVERRLAQQLLNDFRCYLVIFQVAIAGEIECHLAQSLIDLLLQLSHTTLARVPFYYIFQRSLSERQRFLLLQSGLVLLARHEVTLGYLYLLFGGISTDLYYLHPVTQRCRDG